MKRLECNQKVLAKKVKVASGFFDRLLGLMFKKEMNDYDCLKITPCNSIHTMFMRFPIDVIFSDKDGKVVKVIRNIKPWRMTKIYFSASVVYEFNAGTIDEQLDESQTLEEVCLS